MYKWIMFSLFIVASALAVVFSIQAALDHEPEEEAAAGENELVIVGENFQFNKAEFTAKAGEPIKVTYRNKPGGGIHAIAIPGTDIKLQTKESVEFTFEPGVYDVVCDLMCGEGHAQMISKLIVQ